MSRCGTSGIIAIEGWAKFFRGATKNGRHLVAEECQHIADLLEMFRTCLTADDDRAMIFWQCGKEAERLLVEESVKVRALEAERFAYREALKKCDAAVPIATAFIRDSGNEALADLLKVAGLEVRGSLSISAETSDQPRRKTDGCVSRFRAKGDKQ